MFGFPNESFGDYVSLTADFALFPEASSHISWALTRAHSSSPVTSLLEIQGRISGWWFSLVLPCPLTKMDLRGVVAQASGICIINSRVCGHNELAELAGGTPHPQLPSPPPLSPSSPSFPTLFSFSPVFDRSLHSDVSHIQGALSLVKPFWEFPKTCSKFCLLCYSRG